MTSTSVSSDGSPFSSASSPSRSPNYRIERGDATDLPVDENTVDCVVTSPPYWQKRDYGVDGQIGQEQTADEYIGHLTAVLDELSRVLHRRGTAFINIGDTFRDRSLVGIPRRFAAAARQSGWTVRNEITWVKNGGLPNPVDNRFTQRTESIFFLTQDTEYYHDRFGYRSEYGKTGDVWEVDVEPDPGTHLAPFPSALVRRALVFGCPPLVCTRCNSAFERNVTPTFDLDEERPQARRAMELYRESDLERKHLEAVRSLGLGTVGKMSEVQTGTGRNTDSVQELAEKARDILGSYSREFIQPPLESDGWQPTCDESCGRSEDSLDTNTRTGVVLDPFVGTGTTVEEAGRLALSGIGTDIAPPSVFQLPLQAQF